MHRGARRKRRADSAETIAARLVSRSFWPPAGLTEPERAALWTWEQLEASGFHELDAAQRDFLGAQWQAAWFDSLMRWALQTHTLQRLPRGRVG